MTPAPSPIAGVARDSSDPSAPPRVVLAILRDTTHGHRALFVFSLSMLLLSAVLTVLLFTDPRTLDGVNVWAKPLRFAISFGIYAASASWLITALPPRRWVRRFTTLAGWAILVAAAAEQAIITFQAARGVRSHYNTSTWFDTQVYAWMGAMIGILYAATTLLAIAVILFRRDPDPIATSVKAGLLIALLGMSIGAIMLVISDHAVGTRPDGASIPLLGWSATNGDLRVSHFVGLHGLQILPIIAGLIAAVGRGRWQLRTQIRLVRLSAAAFTAVVVLLLLQALRAQPLLAPDAVTVVLAIAATAGIGLGVVLVMAVNATAADMDPAPPSPPAEHGAVGRLHTWIDRQRT